MATTTHYSLPLPVDGGDNDNWGTNGLNAGLVLIDTALHAVQVALDEEERIGAERLPKTGGVMTGKIDLHSTRTAVVAAGDLTGTHTFNLSAGDAYTATVIAPVTLTFTPVNSAGMASFILHLTNGGAGTVTFPVTVKWPGGLRPSLTAAGVDVLAFLTFDAGTTWIGTSLLDVIVPA